MAAKLGRSKTMMEKWSRRFQWMARVVAYADHMALVEREAAEAMARVKGVDWAKRYQELREAEWQERKDLLELASEMRKQLNGEVGTVRNPEGYARLIELASTLGHRACEKDLAVSHRVELTGADGGLFGWSWRRR